MPIVGDEMRMFDGILQGVEPQMNVKFSQKCVLFSALDSLFPSISIIWELGMFHEL